MKLLQEICISMLTGFWSFQITGDNHVLFGGEIKFAWTIVIKAEMKTHKEQRIFQVLICILICWMADKSYNVIQEWLLCMNQASAEQSKPKLMWYCTLTPVSWMEREGGGGRSSLTSVCSPQVHLSLTQSESSFEPAVDLCWSLFCNAFNFTVDTCNRLLWTVVTADLFLTWSCCQLLDYCLIKTL